MQLLDMLDEVVEGIKGLRAKEEAPRFATELLERCPEVFADLPGGAVGARAVAQEIALKQLELVAEIPEMVMGVAEGITDPSTHPAIRLMQVTALAYLVNPDDLLPDDLPGGYGFVDDSILLRATIVTSPQILQATPNVVEREKRVIEFHGMCIPPEIAPQMEESVAKATTLIQLLAFMPSILLTDAARRIMDNPLVSFRPQPPPNMAWPRPGGSWFSLPRGRVVSSESGGIQYRVGEGKGAAIDGGGLAPLR
jgi:uncharacterized membrane protein YkvA (DUF1232 family)